ncbi:C-type lectin-like [Erythrolamprus reginae]|uniref:C-type lectin-like n=1 Tax=Erythrolamprus reginae TaxID=121349 RepID=UPI00396CC106
METFHLLLGGFLLAVALPPGAKARECPRGWIQLKRCCYGFFNLRLTWMRAELECQSIKSNSHLASVVSEEETELLSTYLDKNYAEQTAVWIGMFESKKRTPKKRTFEWSDGSPIDYTLWAPKEPRNLKKQCTILAKPDYKLWATRDCGDLRPYLCKYER